MKIPPSPRLPRRAFLRGSALAGAAVAFPAVVRAAAPNSSVQVAVVGVSGRGYSNLHSAASHPSLRYVGFCDVDQASYARADADHPGTRHWTDYRDLLRDLGDRLDAVIVSTPDHMHAPVAVAAMQLGKHVYCEKPLAHTAWECRQLRLWAEKKGVVTQMGNQIHSSVEYRLATRLLREGTIGKVKEVHSWVGVAGNERTCLLEPPAETAPVPAGLDWDRWLGAAPARPFAPGIYHPFAWRDWQDFGGGALGDFGCHILDPVFTGLGLTAPSSVIAENTGVNRHIWPTSQTIRYVFPGTEFTAGPTLPVTWTDGGLRPERKLAQVPAGLELPRSGSLFIGEKGNMVLPHVGGPRLYPEDNFRGFSYPKDVKAVHHHHSWIDAIRSGGRTSGGFHYAAFLAETVQLGNIATRLSRRQTITRGNRQTDVKAGTLHWDSAAFRFRDQPAADALLTKAYRPGWEVPAA